jgi:hypothetical protein
VQPPREFLLTSLLDIAKLADLYIHVQAVWLGDSPDHHHSVLAEHGTVLPLQDLSNAIIQV